MSDVTVASADGTKLAARYSGEGPPIVLVHGAWGSVDTFSLVEPLLAEHHEVWTYSRRGYPGSEGAEDLTPARHVEDMWAVVGAAGGQVHVCGWSAGAMVALLASPGASSLRSVILYEPPLNGGAEWLQELLDAWEPALETGGTEAVLEAFCAAISEPDDAVGALRANPPVWEGLNAGVRGTLGEVRTLLDLPAGAPPPQPPDVPTLYLYGAETSNPVFLTADVVASVLPDAKLRALPGQRHFAPVLDPTGFAEAILEFTSALDA